MRGGGPLVKRVSSVLWPASTLLGRGSAELVLCVLGPHMDATTDVVVSFIRYGSGADGRYRLGPALPHSCA
jgi:hypothetical protein